MKRCPKCNEIKELTFFSKDRKRADGLQPYCKKCNKKYVEENKEKVYLTNRLNRAKNIEQRKEAERQWYLQNKDRKLASNNARKKERRLTDPLFVLKERLSSRINKVFRGLSKSKSTLDLIGCSLEEAKRHIESKFQTGMVWDNRSEWEIDHIYPLSLAKSKEELEKLCHYTNLQPLWTLDNKRKGNSVANLNLNDGLVPQEVM
jgi:hypothetical protein